MKQLIKLARQTLRAYFQNKKPEVLREIKEKFSERQACFVTLTKNNQLRGCIGSLYPHRELYKDVIKNTIDAAFHDPRFSPLTKQELEKTKIEISILSIPKKLEFHDQDDLLKKINQNMGIILKRDYYTSTFLPQVWEQIPDKIDFLERLSLKAGLSQDAWKTCEIYFYTVKKLKETF